MTNSSLPDSCSLYPIKEDEVQLTTELDKEIAQCFEKHERKNALIQKLYGIILVLKDDKNPDRFTQAAHSIRLITDILTRSYKSEVSSNPKDKYDSIIKPIINILKEVDHIRFLENKDNRNNAEKEILSIIQDVQSGQSTMNQKLQSYFVGNRADRVLSKEEEKRIKNILSLWNTLHRQYFLSIAKNDESRVDESEFFEKFNHIKRFWKIACSSVLEGQDDIDSIIGNGIQSLTRHTKEVIKGFIAKPPLYRYFFETLSDPEWFDLLKNEFDSFIVEDKPLKKDEAFPLWPPGIYLIKIADKIPEKVAEIFKDIKTKNPVVIRNALEAILKMPNNVSKTLLPKIDEWFDFYSSGYGALDLFQKYINENEWDNALVLFEILLKLKKDPKTDGVIFRSEQVNLDSVYGSFYHKLITEKPWDVVLITEKMLEWEQVNKYSSDDFSASWRPAIEEHGLNWNHGHPNEVLTSILRDSLELSCKNTDLKASVSEKMQQYLEKGFSIFSRIAMHILRISDVNNDLIQKILSKPEEYHNVNTRHEFLKLANEKFKFLSDVGKFYFLKWLQAPLKPLDYLDLSYEDFEKIQSHQFHRNLCCLPEIMNAYPVLKEKFEEFETNEKIEAPDMAFHHATFFGPTSPIEDADVKQMPPEDLLKYMIEFKPDLSAWKHNSPQGLARIFEKLVENEPEKYNTIAFNLLDKTIYPTYLSSFLAGLRIACRNQRVFKLDIVIYLGLKIIKTFEWDLPRKENDRSWFDLGTFSWVRGNLAGLFEEIANIDSFPLQEIEMMQMVSILKELVLKDTDPEPSDEDKNTDFVQKCINCNRGKALHALMALALRWVRQNKLTLTETSRFMPGIKELLTDVLNNEKSPSVQSTFGTFLTNLNYLDRSWVKEQIEKSLLFPKSEINELIWKAHTEGFLFHCRGISDSFLEIMCPQLELVIKKLPLWKEKETPYPRKLSEIIMWIFYYKKSSGDKLVEALLKSQNKKVYQYAIEFVPRLIENSIESNRDVPWEKLLNLWNQYIQIPCEENDSFSTWLECIKENMNLGEERLRPLIRPILPFLKHGFSIKCLLNFLEFRADKETAFVLDLFIEFLKMVPPRMPELYWDNNLIGNILQKACNHSSDLSIKDRINSVVNRLGELEFFEFRKFMIK